MFNAIRSRFNTALGQFIRRRTPSTRTPIRLSRRRLYILPTRSGGIFALLLLVMLLGATNYSNSLGFALTFWLAALALVSMHHAHGNLVGLQIARVRATPIFAGNPAHFEITLTNDSARAGRAVRIGAGGDSAAASVDIAPEIPATATINVAATVRGRLACPRLRVESIYPMALFKAWSWVQPQATTLVYPRLAGRDRLPDASGGEQTAQARTRRGHDDFAGHRRYVPGDSPRHLDWKASAKSDALLIREYDDMAAQTLWLDYDRLTGLDRESRLSQLALWVRNAERAGVRYGLSLPGERIEPDQGSAHRRACLQALALF